MKETNETEVLMYKLTQVYMHYYKQLYCTMADVSYIESSVSSNIIAFFVSSFIRYNILLGTIISYNLPIKKIKYKPSTILFVNRWNDKSLKTHIHQVMRLKLELWS
jgi:hypothetical protein